MTVIQFSLGVDFGSLSARAVLMDIDSGTVLASETCAYPCGILTEKLPDGTPVPPGSALQIPSDYRHALIESVRGVVRKSGADPSRVIGIGLDVTSSTLLPVFEDASPLCEKEAFRSNPHAYIKLWRHHTAEKYTDAIAEKFRLFYPSRFEDFGSYVSGEHFLPKAAEIAIEAPEVFDACSRIMEVGDWLVSLLTGEMSRGYCAAAYKTYYDLSEGDLSDACLKEIHPCLEHLTRKFPAPVRYPGDCAGYLTAESAETLGLPAGIAVSAAGVDAHTTIAGCGITMPGSTLLVVGTSTCIMSLNENRHSVKGLNGVVRNGIFPGMYCYEGGQSGVGDMFSWLADKIAPHTCVEEAEKEGVSVHQLLTRKASLLKPGKSGLLALDWFNGVRSTLMDFSLSGLIMGLTCETRPEEIYRAMLEATAFGAKKILKTMEENGVRSEQIYVTGGIPLKNPLMMQIYADVFEKDIQVINSPLTGSAGSAVLGCAAGLGIGFDGLPVLAERMCRHDRITYTSDSTNYDLYRDLYRAYEKAYSFFGEGDVLPFLYRCKK